METRNYLRRFFFILFPMSFLIIFSSCNKTIETSGVPSLTTKTPASITESSADVGGFITFDGGSAVSERGVCYGIKTNPSVSDFAVKEGSGIGNFLCTLTGLVPSTNYYIRAYALNNSGIGYGNQVMFTTLGSTGSPIVTTLPVINITENTASCGGNVTSEGTSVVTGRGICWSTSQNPTFIDSHTTDGDGTGSFTSSINGLNANTVYYVRAYATNAKGTSYGNQESFTSAGSGNIPTVITTSVSNITNTSATSGGNVSSQGSSVITSRGVCWSMSQNPTILDNHTADGSGTGSFTSDLSGLTSSTSYYIRAYAINSVGVAYGEILNFKTGEGPVSCPSSIIYEGKTYSAVEIGTQCWLKDNLNVGTQINGSEPQNYTNTIIEKYCYDDLESNCDIYGALYQWSEMMQGSTTPGDQGICPQGWHVPTDAEWKALADYLGGDSIAGGKIKKSGINLWKSPNTGATNESGFTALPGGNHDIPDKFLNLLTTATLWSSSQGEATVAWYRSLYYSSESLGRYSGQKTTGSSVRCIKD